MKAHKLPAFVAGAYALMLAASPEAVAATKDKATGLTINKLAVEAGKLVLQGRTKTARQKVVIKIGNLTVSGTAKRNNLNINVTLTPTLAAALSKTCQAVLSVGSKNSAPLVVSGCGLIGPAGPASLTPQGAWNADKDYKVNDLFTFEGSTYRVIANHKNKAPNVVHTPPVFEIFAAGAVGATGAAGPAGQGFRFRGAFQTPMPDEAENGPLTAWDVVTHEGSTYLVVGEEVTTVPGTPGSENEFKVMSLKGAKGDQGDPGPVGMNLKYDWANQEEYKKGDVVVHYFGDIAATFIATADNVGQPPLLDPPLGTATPWQLLANGVQGPPGPAGSAVYSYPINAEVPQGGNPPLAVTDVTNDGDTANDYVWLNPNAVAIVSTVKPNKVLTGHFTTAASVNLAAQDVGVALCIVPNNLPQKPDPQPLIPGQFIKFRLTNTPNTGVAVAARGILTAATGYDVGPCVRKDFAGNITVDAIQGYVMVTDN